MNRVIWGDPREQELAELRQKVERLEAERARLVKEVADLHDELDATLRAQEDGWGY